MTVLKFVRVFTLLFKIVWIRSAKFMAPTPPAEVPDKMKVSACVRGVSWSNSERMLRAILSPLKWIKAGSFEFLKW